MHSIKKYMQYILYKYKLSIMQFLEYPISVIPLMLAWFISDVVEFYIGYKRSLLFNADCVN